MHIYIKYLVNQKYYAEVLCENKDVEDSCCEGKCAMEKELLILTEKEDSKPSQNENAIFKFSKVEEAVCNSLKLSISFGEILIIDTPFCVKTEKGNASTLIKPPIG